ncbi:hypothetical protein m4_igs_805 [Acanthamoeba polyphaga mimivirus]|nr:hypothetical protein m4_igs_805 [Acanthamoeba polyphaga mimivirus]
MSIDLIIANQSILNINFIFGNINKIDIINT